MAKKGSLNDHHSFLLDGFEPFPFGKDVSAQEIWHYQMFWKQYTIWQNIMDEAYHRPPDAIFDIVGGAYPEIL